MKSIGPSATFLLFLGCFSSPAQIVIPGPAPLPPFQQVKAYLALTDSQMAQIVLNLNDYSRLVAQRQQRMFQVQSEIQTETAKSPLDPAALGIRYAEIESICRNVRDEAAATQNRNLGVLTDAQKVKLKALDDAYKLFPVISEAQNAGLLTPPGPYSPYQPQFAGASFLTPVISPVLLSGCQQTAFPGSIIPAGLLGGDFSGSVPPNP